MLLLTAMIAMAVRTLARDQRRVMAALGGNPWILILFLYMGVSVVWSEVPLDSGKRWIRTCGDLAMALVLATADNPLIALKETFRRGCLLLIPLSLVLSKYFPDLGRLQEKDWAPDTWIGVATHKNTLGMLCLLSSFYFFAEILAARKVLRRSWRQILQQNRVEIVYLMMSLYLLLGVGANKNSVSSTSKLCFIMAVGLFLWVERYRWRPRLAAPAVLGVLATVIALQLTLSGVFNSSLREVVARSQGKDPTLAERTDLWADLMRLGDKHALFGSGYASFWSSTTGDYVRTIYTWAPWQAHNGYVETFLNLGWIGVGLLSAVIVSAVMGTFRTLQTNFDYGLWRLVLLSCCLGENYAEAGFPRPTHVLWFTFLAVALNEPQRTASAITTASHGGNWGAIGADPSLAL